jgi:hypothetical protein
MKKKLLSKIRQTWKVIIKRKDFNIYHCCVQKTASQWFVAFFNDPIFWKFTRLFPYNPRTNFNPRNPEDLKKLNSLPIGAIVSPLYIRYGDFLVMDKPKSYKAFYVIRDPRDLVISDYFSLRYSHSSNPYVIEMRHKLSSMSINDGIEKRIRNFEFGYFSVLKEWIKANHDNNLQVYKYEDLFGPEKRDFIKNLLAHCCIYMPEKTINYLMDRYSFEKFSGGRIPGEEDIHSHYRSGKAGDWKKYFTNDHITLFKELSGDLLVKMGYEINDDWQ